MYVRATCTRTGGTVYLTRWRAIPNAAFGLIGHVLDACPVEVGPKGSARYSFLRERDARIVAHLDQRAGSLILVPANGDRRWAAPVPGEGWVGVNPETGWPEWWPPHLPGMAEAVTVSSLPKPVRA